MMTAPKKRYNLKDPRVCRIFFSSPFNGMEGEREGLTKTYWPQIASLCASKGLQFVPVDMRWGITTDHSDAALTISICLREIDRSDLFVGFFGQRYGWYGREDKDLQQNFDMAVGKYPWLDSFRDRSVTELEFLHGHLNHPGELPACICFRDKAFDIEMLEKAKNAQDKRGIRKFSPESEESIKAMDDLKRRVLESEAKTLGVLMDYKDPAEGAKFMFAKIWQYLTEVLLSDSAEEAVLSRMQEEYQQHQTFCRRLSTGYLGRSDYTAQLNMFVSNNTCQGLVVAGPIGSGKSALLSNWIESLEADKSTESVIFYHFIGCSKDSASVKNYLLQVVSHLQIELYGKVEENVSDKEEQVLMTEFQKLMHKYSSAQKKVIIIIDGIESFQYALKLSIPLYWLPKDIPDCVHFVLGCRSTHSLSMEELVETRKFRTLQIAPLESGLIKEMCKERLLLRGKELSSAQLETVVNAQNTNNPLFLSVVLEELCMFGNFRQLDAKITALTDCTSCEELFYLYIQRLEKDFNTDEIPDLVEKVLSAMCVSVNGLSESEIARWFDIPSHVWSPLFYNLESYIFDRAGYLKFMQEDLVRAIEKRYIPTKEKKLKVISLLKNFMLKEITHESMEAIPHHYPLETVSLVRQTENIDDLKEVITNMPIFTHLINHQPFTLLECVQLCGWSQREFIEVFNNAINAHAAGMYHYLQQEFLDVVPNLLQELLAQINSVSRLLEIAKFHDAHKFFLTRSIRLIEENKNVTEDKRKSMLPLYSYPLACLHAETSHYQESHDLHTEIIEMIEGRVKKSVDLIDTLGKSYHGKGIALSKLGRLDEAEEMFRKSIKSHNPVQNQQEVKENECKSLFMIAELSSQRRDDQKAVELYEEVLKMQEDVYFGQLPPETAYALTNMGNCYRRLGNVDKAEQVLLRAMEIKFKAFGEYHHDTAVGYVPLANLYWSQERTELVEENLKKAIHVFNVIGHSDSEDAIKAKENWLLLLVTAHANGNPRMKEGEEIYWQVFDALKEQGMLEIGIPEVHNNYMNLFMQLEEYKKVLKLTSGFIHTKTRCIPMHYFNFHLIKMQNLCKQPEESLAASLEETKEEELDTGISRFPADRALAFLKIEMVLIPSHDLEGVIAVTDNCLKHYEDAETKEDFILRCSRTCLQKEWVEGAVQVLEHYESKFSNSENISAQLGEIHFTAKNYSLALGYLQKQNTTASENVNTKIRLAQCSLLAGEYDVAEKTIAEMKAAWPDVAEIQEKVETLKIYLDEARKN